MRTPGKLQLAHWLSATLALVLIAGFAVAQTTNASDQTPRRSFGNMYASWGDVHVTGAEIQALFAAGGTVAVDANVRETAHVAGRRVRVNSPVGESVYAAGYSVEINAPVGEDVIAAGYDVETGPNAMIARDVFARGHTIVLRGPVSGDVSLSANTVEIAAPISGSADIRANEIRFGEGARIGGTLLYSASSPVNVPPSVAPPERVQATVENRLPADIGMFIGSVLMVVFSVIVLGLSAVFAYLLSDRLTSTREAIAARPWRDLLFGIIAVSALVGSVAVLAVSLIGIPLIPVIVMVAPLVILAGYLTTAHAIGSVVIMRARRLPGNFWAAFGAILLGGFVLLLASAIPLLGWVIVVLAITVGIGAWLTLIVRSRRDIIPAE